VGVVTAGEVAAVGAFDLHHPRTQIGQLADGVGRGHRLLQTDDRDPGQRW
jgi:hypothetical protein